MTRSCLLLAAAALTSSCGGKPTCPSGDLACLFDSLTWRDLDSSANAGPKVTLYAVGTGPLAATQRLDRSPDGGNADGGFFVTGPATLTWDSSSSSQIIALIWSDPFGCRPALCLSACPRNAQCLGGSRCTGTVGDGLNRGFTTHQVEYGSQPAADLDFDLDVTPAAAPGCPTDVTVLLAAASTQVLVGGTAIVQVHVPGAHGQSADGGTTGGGSGDWYYHWNCHGDSECEATNPNGTETGNNDEGPNQVDCTQLMTFAAKFWGAAATNACDHSPTWSG